MDKLNFSTKTVLLIFLIITIFFWTNCKFDESGVPSIASIMGAYAPVTKISKSGGKPILHAPGQLYVYHGFDCGNSKLPDLVHIKRTIDLPNTQFTNAVVYLNGWRLRFHKEESEIIGLGAGIGKTTLKGKQLSWEAVGGIGGEDADQQIEFCYYYTVVAWTNFMPNTVINQEDFSDIKDYRPSAYHSALLLVSRYLNNVAFDPLQFAGILPKGFGFIWGDYDEDYFLQAAYHLGPSDRYVYGKIRYGSHGYSPLPALPIPSNSSNIVDIAKKGYVSWNSSAIFKNGDSPDKFVFGDMVVGVGGDNFGMINPHFGLYERKQVDAARGKIKTQQYTIENIPYHFAAPVLKGWNLYLPIDDEQVREIGIWIDSFQYKRNGKFGTLTYKLSYTYSDDENSIIEAEPLVAVFGVKQVWPD